MIQMHIERMEPKGGRALANIKITYGLDSTPPTEVWADVTTEDIDLVILELTRARHLLREVKQHHIGKCNECLMNAIGESEPK